MQTLVVVDATGAGIEQNVPAALWKGTHASNAFKLNSGSHGLGFFNSAATTALTLNVGQGASCTVGAGVTLNTLNNYGEFIDRLKKQGAKEERKDYKLK